MKDFLRWLMVHFHPIQDWKYDLQFIKRNLNNGVHEEDFKAIALLPRERHQVYLDIGSNRGEAIHSMINMLRGHKSMKIIGFEPNSIVYNKILKRFDQNDQLRVYNYGLSDQEGEFSFFIPFYKNWMFDGLASFKKEEAADWLKTRLWNFKEKHLELKEVHCETKTLDSFHLNPFFMKLDVQGLELAVLKGGIQTISKNRPVLLIESISNEIEMFLKPMGYQFYRYDAGKFLLGRGALNTFCIHRNSGIV